MLVEDLFILYTFEGFPEYVIPNSQVGDEEQQKAQDRVIVEWQQGQDDHENAGDDDPGQKVFLFIGHDTVSFLKFLDQVNTQLISKSRFATLCALLRASVS